MRNSKPRPERMDYDPSDFDAGTAYFSALEVGQYVLLLNHAWRDDHGCTLTNDPLKLARIARSESVSLVVMEKFKQDEDGRLYNERQQREWWDAVHRLEEWKDKSAAGGRASAAKRKQRSTNREPKFQPNPNHFQATQTQPQTETRPEENVGGKEGGSPSSPVCRDCRSGHPCWRHKVKPEKPKPVLSPEAQRLISGLAVVLNQDPQSSWDEYAPKILSVSDNVDELLEVACLAVQDKFWTERLTGMKQFHKLLLSDSEKGLLPWWRAKKRKLKILAKQEQEPAAEKPVKKARFA